MIALLGAGDDAEPTRSAVVEAGRVPSAGPMCARGPGSWSRARAGAKVLAVDPAGPRRRRLGQTTTQSFFPSHRPWSTTGPKDPAGAAQRSPGRSGCRAARRFFSRSRSSSVTQTPSPVRMAWAAAARKRIYRGVREPPRNLEAQMSGIFQQAHDIVQAKGEQGARRRREAGQRSSTSPTREDARADHPGARSAGWSNIAASKKRIELQEEQLQHSVDHLQDQAKQALQANREDLAKEALARKATAQQQIDQMAPQHQQLVDEEQKLTKTLDVLQKRVNDFQPQKETLKAQYTAAASPSPRSTRARPGSRSSVNDSGAALQRAHGQDRQHVQARSGVPCRTSCSSPVSSSGRRRRQRRTSRRSSTFRSARDPRSTPSSPP